MCYKTADGHADINAGALAVTPSPYLELLVTMTILGVLIALLMPALMFARESARRTVCTSHLRAIGVAMHHHHNSHRRLPHIKTVKSD